MRSFVEIVIHCPFGISDNIVATPLSAILKHNYPAAKLTWVGVDSVSELLQTTCPSIDDFLSLPAMQGWLAPIKTMRQLKADLLVDLGDLPSSPLASLFSGAHLLSCNKPNGFDPHTHILDQLIEVIRPVAPETPEHLFPSLFPQLKAEEIAHKLGLNDDTVKFIGVVPGVGRNETTRALPVEAWSYFVDDIARDRTRIPIIIGGKNDLATCQAVVDGSTTKPMNTAGKLSLVETAALLKNMDVLVAPDTAPIHLAIAVGTPVIGLYGASRSAYRGPYGCQEYVLDQSARCKCLDFTTCNNAGVPGPGNCMQTIMLSEVMERVNLILDREK